MDELTAILTAARGAYRRGEWPDARARFAAARAHADLGADDLWNLADAAWWLGMVEESTSAGEGAYGAFLQEGRPRKAAMAAVGVAVNFFLAGDSAVGSGWIGRAARLLADEPECAEHGYLLYFLEVEGALDHPDRDAVIGAARRVREIGRRHDDPNLLALSLLGEGRIRLRQGRVPEGMALLDEAMLPVLAGELTPDFAGNIYCHMMTACHELGDLRRARQWLEATTRWLETLPAAVLFTGICRVHRSQVQQALGEWERSEREAAQVCVDLATMHCLSAAEGHYQLGELHRLRGDLVSAEREYQHAHRLGRDPQPGFALLRLAQGRTAAAAASVRAALLAETHNRLVRARLCAAQVEIAVAAGEPDAARAAADELTDTATAFHSPGFAAAAGLAVGTVLLAENRPTAALPVLRDACRQWQDLQAPYDGARVRVLLARAHQALGDADGAELELSAAAEVFERLGAKPDAAAVAALRGVPALPGGLTDREAQVLSCLAAGRTNREIAAALVISEKTVARHLSNIFTKLGLTSRTAATAFAHRHGIC